MNPRPVGRLLAVIAVYYAISAAGFSLLSRAGIEYTDPRITWAALPQMLVLAGLVWWVQRDSWPPVRSLLRRGPDSTLEHLLPLTAVLTVVVVWVEALVRGMFAPVLLSSTVLALLIGFAEEGMFRKYLLDAAGPTWRSLVGCTVLSVISFGAVHLVNVTSGMSLSAALGQSVGAMGFGACFAVLYLATRSIWALVAWHATVDFGLFAAHAGDLYSPGVIGLLVDAVVIISLLMLVLRAWRHRATWRSWPALAAARR
ncbi:CPBP family intramembrane glutamic endopeptidase [Arsenicicoccus dermatophilus]|uniref:CPBP family intramembrane glutamic endopeptidase n=1 Tax=Arsenicicoccus dermatophilus TaxID=1076331 RepID=UPI001F4C9763|nr:CPBP family intramembrane glutamic endopeptidase [Arsenicicoccus dermatophilus]MCH8611984.1 CPBP family intramembrane metalloprotease [Arsenicicoccus dermatophilus]